MPASPTPPPPGGPSRWFADRPLPVKFGVLVGVVVLAFVGSSGRCSPATPACGRPRSVPSSLLEV